MYIFIGLVNEVWPLWDRDLLDEQILFSQQDRPAWQRVQNWNVGNVVQQPLADLHGMNNNAGFKSLNKQRR